MSKLRFHNGGCLLAPVEPIHPTRIIRDHELILVQRGRLALFEGQQHYQIDPDQFLHLSPGVTHGGLAPYAADLRFIWLHFMAPAAVIAGLPVTGSLRRPHIAAELASRLLDEQDRDDAPAGSCDLLMHLLLLECGNSQAADDSDPQGLAERARIFIAAHHREAISTRDVAMHCGCHPDHLGRIFKQRFGRSLGQAILAERLTTAKALLRDGRNSIEAIAQASGFSEAHYFRRIFKRATGNAPGAWRRQHQRMRVNAR